MASLKVTPDTTKAEIGEAITHLRTKWLVAVRPADIGALDAQIDELLTSWDQAPA